MSQVEYIYINNKSSFNPVDKPDGDLLSLKERFKGKYIPLSFQAGLLVFSSALFGLAFGAVALGYAAAKRAAFVAYFIYAKRKKQNDILNNDDKITLYDLSNSEDKGIFDRRFMGYQNGFSEAYLDLAKKVNFKEAPIIAVDETDKLVSGNYTFPYIKNQKNIIKLGVSTLKDYPKAEVLGLSAQEMGYIKMDGEKRRGITNLSMILLVANISFAISLGFKTNVLLAPIAATLFPLPIGAIFGVVLIAASFIPFLKGKQYYKKQADRFALLNTGLANEMASNLEKRASKKDSKLHKDLQKGKLSARFSKAVLGLRKTEPFIYERAEYMRSFSKKNPAFCNKKLKELKL